MSTLDTLAGRLGHLMMALQQDGRLDDSATVHEALDALAAGAPAAEAPERFAIVALMGHRQVAGRVSEEMFAGTPMCRVDIPLADGTFSTRLFGGAAIYEITFVEEDIARSVAKRDPAHPVSPWSARSLGLLPAPAAPEPLTIDRDAFLAEEQEDGDGEDEEEAEYGPCPDGDQIDQVDEARAEDGTEPVRETEQYALAAAEGPI